ncbi:MAG: hypothetical protein ABJC63_01245 [Gemmatimonadales bacterium]
MIGQLPPFALATPGFRFKALASHAGHAAIGGDREVALACFVAARLIAGMLPPLSISSVDSVARSAAARQWLSSLSVPALTRAAVSAAIEAASNGDPSAGRQAVKMLIEAVGPRLDLASVNELKELALELA